MEPKIILGVSGSRFIFRDDIVFAKLNEWMDKYGRPDLLVSGGCRGVDQSCERWAHSKQIPVDTKLPDYKTYGKGAPLVRNQEIVDRATHLIAFPIPESRGTFHTLELAQKKGIPFEIYVCRK